MSSLVAALDLPRASAQGPAWPGSVLALIFAVFAGCPVLANLVSTYVADGQSFAVTATIACTALGMALLAAVRLGIPADTITSLHGSILALGIISVLFWGHWILLNLISPSPQEMMRNQVFQAAIWLLAPLALFAGWRRWIDPHQVVRFLVVLYILFLVGLSLRWVLGLGLYHSGRWHAGHSLEAIRSGRYATIALWVLVLAAFCPPSIIPFRLKLAAIGCLPLALLMMIAANARGPWLALVVTIALTCIPVGRLLAHRIGRDARVLAVLLVVVVGVTVVVASQIGGVESDFNRLFTLTKDGGSAAGRITLVEDHLQLLSDTPQALLSGFGYGHGYFYPHNTLVESLTNGGVFSLVLYLGMIVVTLHAWIARSPRDDVLCLLFVGMFLLSLIGSQVSGGIASDLTWYFPLLLMLAIARSTALPIPKTAPPTRVDPHRGLVG